MFSASFLAYLRMLESTENPSRRRWYCSSVMSRASFGEFGHWNLPSLSRNVNRQNPVPSKSKPLIRSFLPPQKRNSVPSSKGLSPYARRTSAANPSRPLRVSVRPTASITRLIPAASLSMVNHRQNRRQCFFADRIPYKNLVVSVLNHSIC